MKTVTQILGTRYPLIQAPMSWLTDANLVAAVSKAGGLGVFGPYAGQTVASTDPIETAQRMRAEIDKLRAQIDQPFGINILTPAPDEAVAAHPFTAAMLAMAYAAGVKVYVVVGTAHPALFADIKQHGGTIVFRPLTPTVAEMQAGERLGADLLVATGSDEGGVLPQQELGTFTVVPTMVDAVNIPVLAAGGINDVRGVRAAFALGAQGVYIGSRFLLTQEAPMAAVAKEAVKNAHFADIVRVSATQRSLKTPAANRYAKQYAQTQDTNRQINMNGGLNPGMLQGDFEHGIISVNNGVDNLKSIPTVAALIQTLMAVDRTI